LIDAKSPPFLLDQTPLRAGKLVANRDPILRAVLLLEALPIDDWAITGVDEDHTARASSEGCLRCAEGLAAADVRVVSDSGQGGIGRAGVDVERSEVRQDQRRRQGWGWRSERQRLRLTTARERERQRAARDVHAPTGDTHPAAL
jgi:hypothetical protein